MSREQAREIIENLINQITAKKADFEMLEKALATLYYPPMEKTECKPTDEHIPF